MYAWSHCIALCTRISTVLFMRTHMCSEPSPSFCVQYQHLGVRAHICTHVFNAHSVCHSGTWAATELEPSGGRWYAEINASEKEKSKQTSAQKCKYEPETRTISKESAQNTAMKYCMESSKQNKEQQWSRTARITKDAHT